jgi:predicted amidophosphoribosyltransferase
LVFLLGIAGLLTLLCAQEWPARVACPNCKKLRAVDRELCEHCQAPFPPPEKNGTEIFAPLTAD